MKFVTFWYKNSLSPSLMSEGKKRIFLLKSQWVKGRLLNYHKRPQFKTMTRNLKPYILNIHFFFQNEPYLKFIALQSGVVKLQLNLHCCYATLLHRTHLLCNILLKNCVSDPSVIFEDSVIFLFQIIIIITELLKGYSL